MTAKELHDQITDYLGARNSTSDVSVDIDNARNSDPERGAIFEREIDNKIVIQKKYDSPHDESQTSAPSLVESLDSTQNAPRTNQVRVQSAVTRIPIMDRLSDIFLSSGGLMFACALVALGIYLYTKTEKTDPAEIVKNLPSTPTESHEDSRPKGPENLFNKAAIDLSSVLSGEFVLQEQTENAQDLKKWFSENSVPFDVPLIVRGKVVGGTVTGSGVNAVAQVVFSSGKSVIYCVEAQADALKNKKTVYLTEDIMKRLDAGESIWETPNASQSVVLFKQGNVAIAISGNMGRSELEALITRK